MICHSVAIHRWAVEKYCIEVLPGEMQFVSVDADTSLESCHLRLYARRKNEHPSNPKQRFTNDKTCKSYLFYIIAP